MEEFDGGGAVEEGVRRGNETRVGLVVVMGAPFVAMQKAFTKSAKNKKGKKRTQRR